MGLKEEHINVAAVLIGKNLEQQYGVNAIHCGNVPKDWVKPGGLNENNYRKTIKGMQYLSDAIEIGELKHPKHKRGIDLYQRLVNITNHVRTHK